MIKPIIDPSTLTEEQREAINLAMKAAHIWAPTRELNILMTGAIAAFVSIFGKDFFEKGE